MTPEFVWIIISVSMTAIVAICSCWFGYSWAKHKFYGKTIKIVEGKLEDFTKNSEVIFYEDGQVRVLQNGQPLMIEDQEGEIGLFVLVRKFKSAQNNGQERQPIGL